MKEYLQKYRFLTFSTFSTWVIIIIACLFLKTESVSWLKIYLIATFGSLFNYAVILAIYKSTIQNETKDIECTLEKIGNGEFSERVNEENKSEMKKTAIKVNQTAKSLKEFFEINQELSQLAEESSRKMKETLEDFTTITEQVSMAIEEIAKEMKVTSKNQP